MNVTVCPRVYDPIGTGRFIVYFDDGMNVTAQETRAGRVVAHLQSLDEDELEEQSILFFKWLVLYPLSSDNQIYAAALLAFFHSKGKLLCKSSVIRPQLQQKPRYLVIFSLGGQSQHVFSRIYNSIREIKADTGRKPSQIIRRPTKELICKPLAQS